MERLEEIRQTFVTMREEMKRQTQIVFTEMTKDIFERYPRVEAMYWPQYTPYFCDGDPCEFNVQGELDYGMGLILDGERVDSEEIINYTPTGQKLTGTYGNGSSYEYEGYHHVSYPEYEDVGGALIDLYALLNTFEGEELKHVFGEGLVIINRDGTIDVEDYSHD